MMNRSPPSLHDIAAMPTALRRLAPLLLLSSLLVVGACGDEEPASPDPSDDVVGPAGGTLSFESGAVRLVVPSGAVGGDLRVTVSPSAGPGGPLAVPGAAWDLGPEGTSFASPVTLRLTYDPSALPGGVRSGELGVYRALAGAWQRVDGSSVNTTDNSVSASLTGFSVYGVVAAPVASLTIAPDPATVEPGATLALVARPTSALGLELPDRSVQWESADAAVASVDVDGVVTGVATGTTVITAAVEGVSRSVTVDVRRVVAEVAVEPDDVDLIVGQAANLEATPRAGDGTALDREVTWTSDDPTLVAVDQEGGLTAVAEGQTTVRATADGVDGTATVTVTNPVSTIEVAANVAGVVEGGTAAVSAVVRNAVGAVVDRAVTWSSSDESVATVASDGVVTAVAPGVVNLTAEVDGVQGSVALTVTIDWTQLAGTWSGTWTNTSFASSDAINATITIDIETLSAVMVLDVDGFVFGQLNPLPMTILGTLMPTTMVVDYNAPLHGRVAFELALGAFDLQSESVPAACCSAWTYTGTNSTTEHSGSFTVEFPGGGSAQGVVTVTKQN